MDYPENGFIIICDIVAFSEKPGPEQVRCVQFLDSQLGIVSSQLGLETKLYVNCTGDGFLAAFPTSAIRVPHEKCLELCQAIIAACERYEGIDDTPDRHRNLRVRFGIHKDDYTKGVHVFQREHMIGRGPNQAARVAAVGDESHVVVSREFLDYSSSPAWVSSFTGPHRIPIKHNREAEIFIHKGSTGEKAELPRRVFLLDRINGYVEREMEVLVSSLHEHLDRLPPANLRLRVSVFLPDASDHLCSEYRYHWEEGLRSPGKTKYTSAPPQGVIGLAYAQQRIVMELGLPGKADKEAYARRWLEMEHYNLTREHLDGWSRRPEALIAIPFGTGPQRHDLKAVLCVDSRNSFKDFPEETLRGAAEELQGQMNDRLAWKLLARRFV